MPTQLTTLDILYVILAIDVSLITLFLILLLAKVIRVLDAVRTLSLILTDIAGDIYHLKAQAKSGYFRTISTLIDAVTGKRR